MTIPISSNYPKSLDSDTNLYVVRDGLRVLLADDYIPGDSAIYIEDINENMSRFPSTGILTLTDQCDDKEKRAISFFYGSKTNYSFEDLEILPGFEDVVKPKNFTHVTLNVVADHHNNLKDALIAIQEFVGIKGTIDTEPFGSTLEGRLNFLRKLIFTPRAWFKVVGSTVGIVPLDVVFEDQSFRLGPETIMYLWDFGDHTDSVISTASVISTTSVNCIGTAECCWGVPDCKIISKTYTQPGKFDVTLTVSNIYGQDTVVFKDLINARIEAPDEAIIDFVPGVNQIMTAGEPVGGPYVIPPTIRSSVDDFIDVEIQSGKNPATGRSYSGEQLNSHDQAIDAIVNYTWDMGDHLTHVNQTSTRALYTEGGKYDLTLRTDTRFGAYRITNYKQVIDVVENTNLWLWTFEGGSHSGQFLNYLKLQGSTTANEFGLISETFKSAHTTFYILRNDEFLESDQWKEIENTESEYDVIAHAKREFRRNVAFNSRGTTSSGNGGTCLLHYAGGGTKNSSLVDQVIRSAEYNAFTDVYNFPVSNISHPWNWVFLGGATLNYFILGQNPTAIPMTNPSYQIKTSLDLSSFTSTQSSLTTDNYKNGAHELIQHASIYNSITGLPLNGWFATYRSTWKNNTGYFLRNDGVGTFFRIKSFYKTEGVTTEEFINIKKLPDMDGPTKLEGQLVSLTSGIFFFNNSGNVSAYNDTTGIWETGGPSSDSIAFTSAQDTNVTGFNSGSNTLLASSNGDYAAYLSYDYSRNAFVKFNGQDLTFTVLQSRPTGSQFVMGTY